MIQIYNQTPPVSTPTEITIKVLGTGSQGNAYLLNNEILLDAGIANLSAYLNFNLNLQIKTILISHAHIDHMQGITKNFINDFPNVSSVIVPESYLSNSANLLNSQSAYLTPIPISILNQRPLNCEILYIFDTGHDIANNAYIINYKGKIIMYATDIGNYDSLIVGYTYHASSQTYTFYNTYDVNMNPNLNYQPFDFYMLECNHDLGMLETNKTNAVGSRKKYYTRARAVHLSTKDTVNFLNWVQNAPVLLLHRSFENLPVNEITYWFLKFYKNIYVAINPFEENAFSQNEINEFNLITYLNLIL